MPKNRAPYLLTFVLAFSFAAWIFQGRAAPARQAAETVYDRVMRTQTFRCGYGDWPPFLSKDPNTGKLSGIFYDYAEALGEALHLKIVWAEDVGSGDMIPLLQSGRVDGVCGSIWPNAARAREIDFVRPIYYSAMDAYVRADDHRFDNALERLDDPSVTVVSTDGELAELIAQADFPKAKLLHLPQMTNPSDFFINVATKKADVTFANPAMFAAYDAHNPGMLRRVPAAAPLRIFGNTIALPIGQEKLRRMLDLATDELLTSGKIEKILVKHKPFSDSLLRVNLGFEKKS